MPDVCKEVGQCDDIKQVILLIKQHEKDHIKLDAEIAVIKKEMKEVSEFQAGSKIYVDQILKKLDTLESKMFVFMADTLKSMSDTNNIETKTASAERQTSQQQWQKFAMDIVKLTIVAAVGYMFGGGQSTP